MIKKDVEKPQEKSAKKHDEQEKAIDPKDAQIIELTDTLKRLQAEFENYKKRVDREHINNAKTASAGLIKDFLAVLDSFELALKNNHDENSEMSRTKVLDHAQKSPDIDSNAISAISKFQKGLELIYAQLYSILEIRGLKQIETKNQKFDPFKHEVLMVKECSEPDDIILQEFQKGYILDDVIIRHSKVMIAKHVDNNINADK